MTQPTVPTGPEDALAIARATFQPRWPDGTLAPLHVHEFDIGYLVYASFPPVTDLSRPPEPGGSHLVISKRDGELSYVPNLPPETAIAVYRKHFRPDS
ncbi:hypothetical protein OG607_21165 [Streptomyces sp. NBC_01537]|jgi:hypothetical protein|uniref:hypothetical protein n=1 Tax=Streptomyces sp. NBC_01537 TaxID=2903896 RepID=UPI003866BCA0